MSVSPQSLARTRDKRSLRIPRKFEDFSLITSCDVPPTPSPSLPAKLPSPRTISPKPSQPKKKSKGLSLMARTQNEQSPELADKTGTSTDNSDGLAARGADDGASTADTPLIPDNAPDSPKTTGQSTPHPPSETALTIDEPLESPQPELPISNSTKATTKQSQSLARTRDKRSLRIPRKFEDFSLVTSCDAPPPVLSPQEPAKAPSPKAPSPRTPSPRAPSPRPQPNPKKKSKGLSLMAKPQANPSVPQVNKISASINNTGKVVIKGISSAPSGLVTIPQHNNLSMYINNLMPGMHYGTRLMINEPIYLPRSVAPIAPITVTTQQIANWLQDQATN